MLLLPVVINCPFLYKKVMDDSTARLQAIQDKWRKEYDKTVPDKLKNLEDLILKLKENIDEETLKAFRIEVHKIAGSAGTVGYMPVSVLSKALDLDLHQKLENFKSNPPDLTWIPPFETYLKLIREGFSKVDTSL